MGNIAQGSNSQSIVKKPYTLNLSAGTHSLQLAKVSGKVNFDNIIISP